MRLLSLLCLCVLAGGLPPLRCRPRRVFPPCLDCTQRDLARALSRCGVALPIRIHRPFFAPPYIEVEWNNSRVYAGLFGNRLSIYYTAVALSAMTGIEYPLAPFHYNAITLPPYRLPPSDPATLYHRAREMLHYCSVCPMRNSWLHECPGLWMTPDIRGHLQAAIAPYRAAEKDIVIQFRCGDSHAERKMGLLPYEYYSAALAREVNSTRQVAILLDPIATRNDCCVALAHALAIGLAAQFACDVELLQPRTMAADFALLMRAKLLIASTSTFGLFAAIATHGHAYLPVAPLLMQGTRPCFPHVSWLPTRRTASGCNSSLFDWFVGAASPAVRRRLAAVLRGVWYGPPDAVLTSHRSPFPGRGT
eukprot:EG_transcript_15233